MCGLRSNPIYIAALLVVPGEAWLFLSLALLVYAAVMAVCWHPFVIGYEGRTLRRRSGDACTQYTQAVPRRIPRPPGR